MEKLKNIIKKLVVEIDTESMASGLQIKDDIDGFLFLHIYPKLNEYFERAIPENELWRFEKLELEIDLNSAESIKDISPLIISKLEPEISRLQSEDPILDSPNTKIRSYQKSKAHAFFEFLKTGRYPWWLQSDSPITISDLQLMEKPVFRSNFQRTLESTIALYRLIYQFDYQYISKFYNLFYSEENTAKTILRFSFNSIVGTDHKLRFWSAVFEQDHPTILDVLKAIVRQKAKIVSLPSKGARKNEIKGMILPKKAEKQLFKLLKFCTDNLEIPIQVSAVNSSKLLHEFEVISSIETAATSNRKIARKSELKWDGKVIKKDRKNTSKKEFETGLIFDISKVNSEVKKDSISQEKYPEIETRKFIQKEGIEQQIREEEGTLIGNAGLVLLHPFLKHFFINMDLLSGKKIKSKKQDLAVHLLHYIATRNTEPSEHDLTFEKYLCNIPALQPIDRFIKISNKQKAACDELLEAVLKHWSGLRTNAIDALRSEFLMREGKLTIKEDRHKLFVPRKTQDILLDTLPWNLHLIKLPWKKQMLYVEW